MDGGILLPSCAVGASSQFKAEAAGGRVARVFISYKREDRNAAERLALALESAGFEVWYDFELISGDQYRNVIRRVIDECPAAVVVWSKLSVQSDFVLDEAGHAKAQGKLCPVRIDDVALPFGFGQSHVVDLSTWDGQSSHVEFRKLVQAIELRTGGQGKVTTDFSVSRQDVLDFARAQAARSDAALEQFLHKYSDGSLADIVREQLHQNRLLSNRFKKLPLAARVAAISIFAAIAIGAVYLLISYTIDTKTGVLTGSTVAEPLSETKLAELVKMALELAAKKECGSDIMEPALLSVCHGQIDAIGPTVSILGPILKIESEGRRQSGGYTGTRFLITFEKGQQKWLARGAADGKLAGFWQ